MISISKALELILKNTIHLRSEEVLLNYSFGRMLSEDVEAPVSYPLFDMSAVDGYALRYDDFITGQGLSVHDEIRAGDSPEYQLEKGTALRIFTGAPVPMGVDTVVMQEFVKKNGAMIEIKDKGLIKGANIRKTGEQINKGDTAMVKGGILNPSAIGFLASLGIKSVRVSALPKVGIIVTGNEFVENELKPGKIFESNGIMLQAALKELQIDSSYLHGPDDLEKLKALIEKICSKNDILIITGGISVGDYDFTIPAIEHLGYEIIFRKVAQKPGKPLLFAKKGNKMVFGLAGNPRAALNCFYEYIIPFIKASMGCLTPFLLTIQVPLAQDIEKREGRGQFLAVQFVENGIKVLPQQGSHMLKSFSEAEGIVVLPSDKSKFYRGEKVKVHLLPNL